MFVASLVTFAGCIDLSPRVKSNLVVDGQPWVATRCVSASRDGFNGVDLTSPAKETVRIIPQPDESALVVLFPADGSTPIKMTDCARSRMPPSGMKINGVPAMTGWASFACEGGGRKIEGRVEFERCH
jgi:hypothetical protein